MPPSSVKIRIGASERRITSASETGCLDTTRIEILPEVLAPYGVDLQLQRDMQIPQMLSQQDETDWCFVRRIANQFGMLIFTDSKCLDTTRIEILPCALAFSSTRSSFIT